MTPIIGLCGVARSGKDTFFEYARKYLEETYDVVAARYAFADALKQDINKFLIDKTGISAYTTRNSEKRLIRPMLVAYGSMMREMTNGSYWVNNARRDLEQNRDFDRVTFITDVRYENEYGLVKEYGGVCIHIRRIGSDLKIIEPANEEEAKNDPIVEALAEERITWNTFGDSPESYLDNVRPCMDKYFSPKAQIKA